MVFRINSPSGVGVAGSQDMAQEAECSLPITAHRLHTPAAGQIDDQLVLMGVMPGNAAYATIRSFVLKFEEHGLLSAQKYRNKVKHSVLNK